MMIDTYLALRELKIKARQQVYTLLAGNNLSKLNGEGYDLSEIREYQVGDDVRKINWIITAKMGRPYIKELHANRELSIVVATIMDGSLYFGKSNDKQKKLTEVVALLSYSAQYNGDLLTSISYEDNHTNHTPPTKQIYHIDRFVDHIYRLPLIGSSSSYQDAIEDIFKRIFNPSVIFIIGDFLQEVDLSLLSQKHEVIAIIIRDRIEEYPEKLGEVVLKNPIDGIEINTYFGQKSIDRYITKLEQSDESLIKHFSQYNIRYQKIYSDEEAITKLVALFG